MKTKGKDPAFLCYSGDFLAGTYTMNYEQRGKFITLMCIQHQKGFLTEGDMKSVLTEEDYILFEKFYKDSDGKYYNQKMTDVIEERKSFTESRRLNGLKGGRPKKETKEEANENLMRTKEKPNGYHMLTYRKPNENLLEDEDEDVDLDKDQDKNVNEIESVSGAANVKIEIEHADRSVVGSEEAELEKYYEEEYEKVLNEEVELEEYYQKAIEEEYKVKNLTAEMYKRRWQYSSEHDPKAFDDMIDECIKRNQ